ncbi:unnamed protein product, partial [Prorocentrum cordatum]
MARKYKRNHKRRVVISEGKRGPAFYDAATCVANWVHSKVAVRDERRGRGTPEKLARDVCAAAMAVADSGTATEDHLCAAGCVLFRGRRCAQVLWSHILHWEGFQEHDPDDSVYNIAIPRATGRVTVAQAMKAVSVHSCFHVAHEGAGLSVDPLTASITTLVGKLRRRGFCEDELVKVAALLAFTTSVDVVEDFSARLRKTTILAAVIRGRANYLHDLGYKAFLGRQAGGPHRNRHQSSLSAEDMQVLLVRLDRVVAGGKVYLGQLEEALRSDLMLPHVCDILMSMGFVHLDGPLSTHSSTNVKMAHDIFKDLGQAGPGRAAWVADVCSDLVGIVDAELGRGAGRSKKDLKYFAFLGSVRALLNLFSVVCTALGGALGSTAKLRNGAASPVMVKKAVVAKLSATADKKRAGGRAQGRGTQP